MQFNRMNLQAAIFFVAILALSFTAIRESNELIYTTILYSVYSLLVILTMIGVISNKRKSSLIVFVIVGWSYFLPMFVFGSEDFVKKSFITKLMAQYCSAMRPYPVAPPGFAVMSLQNDWPAITFRRDKRGIQPPTDFVNSINEYNINIKYALNISHLCVTVFLAYLSAMITACVPISIYMDTKKEKKTGADRAS